MKLLGAVLLVASLLGTDAHGEQPPWPDDPSTTCIFQMLNSPDNKFCRGDLEVIYPELGNVGCMYIPKCHRYQRRLSKEWGPPRVLYPQAAQAEPPNSPSLSPQQSCSNLRSSLWPPLDRFQQLRVFPVLRAPELDAALRVRSYQGRGTEAPVSTYTSSSEAPLKAPAEELLPDQGEETGAEPPTSGRTDGKRSLLVLL